MKRFLVTTSVLIAAALPVSARDAALVLDMGTGTTLFRGTDADDVAQALEGAGVTVTLGTARTDGNNPKAAFDRFLADLAKQPGADTVLVTLTGPFVSTPTDTYLVPEDFGASDGLAGAMSRGLPVSAILAVLAAYPGEAMLVLGAAGDPDPNGPFLSPGIGGLTAPQGVTLLTGARADALTFSAAGLNRSGDTVARAEARFNMVASGFVEPGRTLFDPLDIPTPVVVDDGAEQTGPVEINEWDRSRQQDTVAAYRRYLRAYPEGTFADEAKRLIAEIEAEPNRAARLAEEGLSLDRDARRDIQRDLSLLEYNTRGIDGIFGPGTRGAIGNWQSANGLEPTTYLNGQQIARLDGQAERRARELEAEAQRRREEELRRDRAFWSETGAKGDAAGLRAYLGRYPDGAFAEEAQAGIDALQARARQQAAAQDRAAWDSARADDTAKAYRAYLEAFPKGAFAAEAKAAIEEAAAETAAVRQQRQQARAQEDALNLPPQVRRLVEDRLAKLELNPGQIDGTFDQSTRRAIRRFQRDRNLDVTGFIDQETAVRLLAGAILR